MRNNRLATLLALAGIAGASIGVNTAQASMSAAAVNAAASKTATLAKSTVQRQSPMQIKGRYDRNRGGFDNSPAKNQRIKRKNQRRAHAAGFKDAFN